MKLFTDNGSSDFVSFSTDSTNPDSFANFIQIKALSHCHVHIARVKLDGCRSESFGGPIR
jgi:hypothetical protein